jgi:hypothetical protein
MFLVQDTPDNVCCVGSSGSGILMDFMSEHDSRCTSQMLGKFGIGP